MAQSVLYYRSFPRDGRIKKLMVLLLNIAELIQTSALASMFWRLLVANRSGLGGGAARADLAKSHADPWQIKFSFAITALITLLVQCFFCLRVWRVSLGNVLLVLVIGISGLVQLGAMIYLVTHTDNMLDPVNYLSGSSGYWLFSLSFVANILCDGTVAGSLTYYFKSYRTGMPRTEPIIQQLIWLSTSTGLMLCLLNALAWGLAQVDPHHSAKCLAPLLVVGKLYVNSMVANLNSRKHFRAVIERTMDYSIHASAFDTSKYEFATE
ncbi:hypothetical protein FIBSPDRAFT_949839 [Athelia psychrophila]|uniref:DUF6534 domain-containing protein n=1 Tax=Athelia psychrophila TaxID=1759441 RepID=A0A166PG53_9AGAM|nr:hypothetical protein FIBSPDRAFT_949839 [Fibularhizoctonia sp. CBS 109695]